MNLQDTKIMQEILSNTKTIAIVGISDKPDRPSYSVSSYLLDHFEIIPVNPLLSQVFGKTCYPSLLDIPKNISVDLVDIFRRPEVVQEVVEEAIEIGAKYLWLQEGVINESAAKLAIDKGLKVVMDRCIYVEHAKLSAPSQPIFHHEDVVLRYAESKDIQTIVDYNCALAIETEHKQLDVTVVTQGVETLLNNRKYGFYIVAEWQHKIIGQLMISYEWSDWRNGLFWWIQSVYVHNDYRRRGIYRQLYNFIYELCKKDQGVCGVRLYVDKNNSTAQKAYENLGMTKANYDIFEKDFVLGK